MKSPKCNKKQCKRLDNSTMIIKVAGQEYRVTNTKRKSRSLGSLTDLTVENDTDLPNNNLNDDSNKNTSKSYDDKNARNKVIIDDHKACDDIKISCSSNSDNLNYGLCKSKSESNPFEHRKKGKIIRLTERPKPQGNSLFVGMAHDTIA